ncbi:MAG TPA: amidohydrolase, partial [Methanomicrobia archaeon]|nr:amidohydrolase [Methanomicrobia archaeon]
RKEKEIYIEGNRIKKVGQIESLISKNTVVIDAEEKTVIPGFFDSHTHFADMGINRENDVSECKSIEDVLKKIEKKKLNVVHGWDESLFREKRYILKKDLDIFDFPVIAFRVCGHLATLNSAAIEVIDLKELDPKFYVLEKGIFKEDTLSKISKIYPKTIENYVRGIENATELAYSLGVTSIVDTVTPTIFRAYERIENDGKLGIRAHLYMKAKYINNIMNSGLSRIGSEKLRFNGIKIFTDGSLGAKTAALSFNYKGTDQNGILIYKDEELMELIKKIDENELQAMIHCIGDRAIEQVLDCLENIPRKMRHKIEHVEITNEKIRERIRKLKIPCSLQPNFLKWSENMYIERLGDKAVLNNRYKKMIEKGIKMGFGSDCMPFSPLFGIKCAVNDPYGESISIEDAIKIYTSGSAYLAYRENDLGTIGSGKLADIVILSENIFSEIEKIKVEKTIFDGKIVL